MNAIIGYSRPLLPKLSAQIEERQTRNLQNIQTSAHNLLNLINEILDLSRVEAGRVEIQPQVRPEPFIIRRRREPGAAGPIAGPMRTARPSTWA
jgi:signal transduction histidine kinase